MVFYLAVNCTYWGLQGFNVQGLSITVLHCLAYFCIVFTSKMALDTALVGLTLPLTLWLTPVKVLLTLCI